MSRAEPDTDALQDTQHPQQSKYDLIGDIDERVLAAGVLALAAVGLGVGYKLGNMVRAGLDPKS